MSPQRVDDWDDLRFFLAAVRAGSFMRAADDLRTNQTTVGRRIERLETSLGIKLFDRIGRAMRVTPAGKRLMAMAEAMEDAAGAIERDLAGHDRELAGEVTIAAPEGLASFVLTRWLADFRLRYPRITLRIRVGNQVVDLRTRDADMALQLAIPLDPRAVGVKVGTFRVHPFAAPDYLERAGTPRRLEHVFEHDLLDHLGYGALPGFEQWRRLVAEHPHVVFATDSARTYLEAARAGLGIAFLPAYYARAIPELRELDLDLSVAMPLWLVSHSETNGAARVQAVFRYLRERFADPTEERFL
ncbi:LysR family transcriptional regulator [Magnetospirillum sulfuroxidans]|uniref:LysR family transcriptional regulator n=1 Tax=Magnetospirillum sulfuroxidans TaxID=611300 RepID=A0ABS5IFS0_9PROT|nr:LysR family transcriptional regulator [Magnetospirillum sulfuroxidans]MBR9973271.1 LysR family transcriptional regulator [Magnetospirillum sulfuroxidans]